MLSNPRYVEEMVWQWNQRLGKAWKNIKASQANCWGVNVVFKESKNQSSPESGCKDSSCILARIKRPCCHSSRHALITALKVIRFGFKLLVLISSNKHKASSANPGLFFASRNISNLGLTILESFIGLPHWRIQPAGQGVHTPPGARRLPGKKDRSAPASGL